MALSVYSVASGSSGNCMLVTTHKTGIIIDAGITLSALKRAIIHFGVDSSRLSAIFITHQHIDHIKGVGPIARHFGIPIVADPLTLKHIQQKDMAVTKFIEMKIGSDISLSDINIHSFATSHDTPTSCAFELQTAQHKVCYATDTGYVTDGLREYAKNSNLIVLESNYDEIMLNEAPYPQFLKNRIRGKKGHLSNDDAADFIADMIESGYENTDFWLAHLSNNSNTPQIAHACTCNLLHKALGVDKEIKVALRDMPSVSWKSEG